MRLLEPLTEIERPLIISRARELLTAGPGGEPVRFRHKGRTIAGIDCVGVGIYALAAVDRVVEDLAHYGRDPVKDGLRAHLVKHLGDPIPCEQVQPADFVLMRWFEVAGEPMHNHVALVTDCPYGGLSLLHAYAQAKRVVEHRLADPWPRRIVEVFRP